jgi:hypothetical protein
LGEAETKKVIEETESEFNPKLTLNPELNPKPETKKVIKGTGRVLNPNLKLNPRP